MQDTINIERLAEIFTTLCEISSPSRREGAIATWLINCFHELGADSIYVDNSKEKTGSETGNIIVRFNGTKKNRDGFFLSCHMDTVEPADNVKVVRTGDIFTSAGDTILGADDKSGIAAIIGMLQFLREQKIDYPTIEVIITTCEEIGLLGAKYLELDQIQSRYGYALDSTGTNHVITGAPAANKIKVEIKGLASHAGLCPEVGINALSIAVTALHSLQIGRLDEESTCNFGVIEGGVATNIVPETVVLRGEVRSHNPEKLKKYTEQIFTAFTTTVESWPQHSESGRPAVNVSIVDAYPAMLLHDETQVLQRITRAAEAIDCPLRHITAGGGSDANIFNGHGLPTAIVASGMNKVHTFDEQLDLNDLVDLTRLLISLATIEKY